MNPEEQRLVRQIREMESSDAPFGDVLAVCRVLRDVMRRRVERDRLAAPCEIYRDVDGKPHILGLDGKPREITELRARTLLSRDSPNRATGATPRPLPEIGDF